MSEVFYYEGRFINPGETPVAIEERGHQFGDGVYEVVKVYSGRVFLLDWHLDRFERSLRVIGLENPYTRSEWTQLIGESVRRSELSDAQVYFHVTRGTAPRLHTFPSVKPVVSLTVRPAGQKHAHRDVKVLALPDDRWANAYVKSLNLLPNVIAKELASRHGAAEALYVRSGDMLEGAGSNLFFVRNGELITAPANRYILGGITRNFVLELARELNVSIVERALPFDELDTADELFMTSTTQEILPVSKVVASPQIMASLRQLNDADPETLLPQWGDVTAIWEQPGSNSVTSSLIEAFNQRLAAFRLGEPVL